MESQEIISALSLFATSMAILVFPTAVGPTIAASLFKKSTPEQKIDADIADSSGNYGALLRIIIYNSAFNHFLLRLIGLPLLIARQLYYFIVSTEHMNTFN